MNDSDHTAKSISNLANYYFHKQVILAPSRTTGSWPFPMPVVYTTLLCASPTRVTQDKAVAGS